MVIEFDINSGIRYNNIVGNLIIFLIKNKWRKKMSKSYETKIVGLFGTCGNSKWREAFIKRLDELNVSWYNPCREDWNPEEDSYHLKNDKIILMPVTDETYGTGTLSESAFGIVTTLASIYQKSTKLVIYIAPEIKYDANNPNLNNEIAVKESNRARKIVTQHIQVFKGLPNVYFVDNLEKMLEVTELLIKQVELENRIKSLCN